MQTLQRDISHTADHLVPAASFKIPRLRAQEIRPHQLVDVLVFDVGPESPSASVVPIYRPSTRSADRSMLSSIDARWRRSFRRYRESVFEADEALASANQSLLGSTSEKVFREHGAIKP